MVRLELDYYISICNSWSIATRSFATRSQSQRGHLHRVIKCNGSFATRNYNVVICNVTNCNVINRMWSIGTMIKWTPLKYKVSHCMFYCVPAITSTYFNECIRVSKYNNRSILEHVGACDTNL